MDAEGTSSIRIYGRLIQIAVCGLIVVGGTVRTTAGQQCNSPELAKLIAADAAFDDEFGLSVAVSENTAVVGAYLEDNAGGGGAGSAYVFIRTNGVWSQHAKLTAADGAANDQFGYSVAISGDTIVVGAIVDDHVNAGDAGSAYVFVRTGATWTQVAKLTASDMASDDQFGNAVAVSGDTVIVGSFGDDLANGTKMQAGSAYIYARPASGWTNMTETAKLTSSDVDSGDQFGISVAISGNTAVVGANWDDNDAGTNAGAAYVFVRPNSGWVNTTETAKLIASDGTSNDEFGHSVAVSSKTVLVGAFLDDTVAGGETGSAYIFVKPPCEWTNATETAKLTASDAIAGDNFGVSVAIAGQTAVIGASLAPNGGVIAAGSAYVFTRSDGVWTQQSRLTASDSASRDYFGYSVAVSGKTAIIGAFADSHGSGSFAGSSYVFRVESCDSDGDGVPNATDVCPNSPAGPAVDSTGRPLRDCNHDCVFNALDIQCIVDELLNQ